MIKSSNIVLLAATLILTSCADFHGDQKEEEAAPPPIAQKADIPAPHPKQPKQSAIQPNFACTNNVKFNLTFSKHGRFAYIIFQNSVIKETLKDSRVASGVEYGNGKLFFREYKGRTELVHLVHGKMKTEICH